MAYEAVESFYTGSYGPLEPTYGELFTGYRVPFSRVGAPTSPQTANQITEVTSRLSEGLKAVEVSLVSPDVFESIPKEHWKEMARLTKLTGAEASLHAPIIDPAGFTREGWSEAYREQAEIRLKQFIERAHELNPKGNVPLTVHATGGVPSTEWKNVEVPVNPDEPEGPKIKKMGKQIMYAVNQETGQIVPIEREKRFFPKEEIIEPEEMLEIKNTSEWDKNMMPLVQYANEANRILERTWPIIAPKFKEIAEEQERVRIIERLERKEITEAEAMRLSSEIVKEKIGPEFQASWNQFQLAKRYYNEIGKHLTTFYDMAYKYAEPEHKDEVRDFIKKNAEQFREAQTLLRNNPAQATLVFHNLMESLHKVAPQMYVSAEQFALQKSKDTIANAALDAFKKFGDTAPVISLENVHPGTVFGRGEELAKLVKETRDEFVKKAIAQGISETRAREAANKIIGATWDVGHINLMRKYGFPKEAIAEETKKIAPFVKHVHLTDNFGFEDSHLPPGMGEVPFKEILRELERAGFKGREIIEAGGFVAQFKTSPTPYVLEALGSPIYSMEMQPFWNQVRGVYGIPGGYSGGYGMMLPEQHFATYGGGFSALPAELGGVVPGKGQRFSGAPME